MKSCTKFVIALWIFFLLSFVVKAQRAVGNGTPVISGGSGITQQVLDDSTAAIRTDIVGRDELSDSLTTVRSEFPTTLSNTVSVVQANHFTVPTYGFIPVYTNSDGIIQSANLVHLDSTATWYVINKNGDNLTLQQSGQLIVPSHGLVIGKSYYMSFWGEVIDTIQDEYIVQKVCDVINDSTLMLANEQAYQVKNTPVRQSLQSEYYDVLSYAQNAGYVLPEHSVRVLQNNLVKSLKDSSIYQVMDYLHVMITGDTLSQFARINWKNPNQFLLQPTGTTYNGTYGFTSTTNNSGNITFGYVTPANVTNFLQNNSSMNYYVTISNGQNIVMNTNGGSGMHYVYLRNISINNYSGGTYNSSSPGFTCSTCSYGNHVYSIERIINTSVTLYANGSSVTTLSSNSNTGSNRVHQYLANFSTAGSYIGIGMSGAAITGKQSYLNNLLKQYVYDIQAR